MLASLPRPLDATGFDGPAGWLTYGEPAPVLNAPEFFFEIELKRLAGERHPEFKSMPAPREKEADLEEARDYEEQVARADLADFAAALERGTIQPPDRAKAGEAHAAVRRHLRETMPAIRRSAGEEEAVEEKPAAPAIPAPLPPLPAEEFTSEFADYHHGAWAWRHGHRAEARAAWEAVLARPAAERRHRTTWAAFMLGKLAHDEGREDDACVHFQQVRQAAREGFADSIGLAASSLGWEAEAHLHAGRFAPAAQLYLEHLASGEVGAVWSLRDVMGAVFEKGADLASVAGDPVMQRVATACAVAGIGPFSGLDEPHDAPAETRRSAQWLRALEKIGAKNVRDADRVAWIAYGQGRYADAARWLARAEAGAPYVLWLKAKLALRDGKIEAATQLLARALPDLPEVKLESRPLTEYEELPVIVAKSDLGALRIARGDFTTALKLFLEAGRVDDAEYLAEGVLTIPELKDFLAREFPEGRSVARTPALEPALPDAPAKEEEDSYQFDAREELGATLRRILARRLMRAGKHVEARPFFEETEQTKLDRYVTLLERAKESGRSKPEQAQALREAAELIEKDGYELFEIYEVDLQAARLTGRAVSKDDAPKITMSSGDKVSIFPAVTKAEWERLTKHRYAPPRHFLHLYVASELAWRAATLMPDQDEQTARLLNLAGSWLKYRDDGAADRFYQAIERRCGKTELGKKAIQRRWFVPVDEVEGVHPSAQ